ncbi:ATP-binding protein [Fructobacillus evanidus]|uniref:histidine kinase n=1 Tax=Fructobacillus evanidus TaxID=3064281 RepID=A0ABM9N0R3_9LACO|nr:Sensor histidine kinase WalK (WalK) [Fructobacillus sp. LMG 32999]CAK1247212.1 Sensor histidine kinase WalK (WalK) [Fructobacillus sp. LMG 32999]CAK1252025.1 Sensor histidine kinase WalK (WalK) [Fructobacillus sp. LMG 32999]CAK1252048.1 Sensor histidine kinase WalK (WalK) [Fructobacillus sp. LMG 32999]CAK1252097.1 Sensor histidine kinase WalK (WalK) [Fructobacillus sp. LMG 32999]
MKVIVKLLQSIRFRITFVFVLFLIVILESFGVFFVHQIEQHDLIASEAELTMPTYVTKKIVEGLDTGTGNINRSKMDTAVKDFDPNLVENVLVYDKSGKVVSSQSTKKSLLPKAIDSNSEIALDGGNSYLKIRTQDREQGNGQQAVVTRQLYANGTNVPSKSGEKPVGVVVVYASLAKVYANARQILVLFLLAGLLTLVASVYLAFILSRTLTRPIEIINKQTARIAAGDYSMVNTISGSDEISQLAHSVNTLSNRIAESTEIISNERNRLHSVLHHMADGVLLTNANGQLTIINQAATKLLGVSEQAALGQQVFDLLDLPEYQSVRDLIKQQRAMTVDVGQRIIEVRVSLIKNPSGLINAMVLILHDITEQKKIDQDRRDFVSNVSHELRTPLTTVASYVESLQEGAKEDPKILGEFLTVIQNETDRMSRMVSDLLELSRMDQGTMEVKTELVQLNTMLNFILDRFDMILLSPSKDLNLDRKIKIVRHIPTDQEFWVDIDHDKMTQVIDNLMNNAIKYSPDGGTITVSLEKSGDKALISIKDQGLGIPAADQEKVFNRFFRVDKSRSRAQGGTGLGLAISKEVIEKFNGHIWVESKENEGSTFKMTLNYVQDDLLSTEKQWDED